MLPASRKRLFNPLPDNPLHGGSGASESSSERSRMSVDNVPLQQTPKPILRSPDTSPSNHHTTAINTNNVTMADKHNNTFIPTLPWKLVPSFWLVPSEQVVPPGVVPVIPFVSGLPQSLSSPPNLENVTRANLMPLMLSKGIITSPAAAIPPVQAVPQAPQLIPLQQAQYTLQSPLSFPNTLPVTTFPNNQITIQVAQPVLQEIGLNNNGSGLECIPPEGEITSCQSGAASASENHTGTENVGVPQSVQKQLHKKGHHGHTPQHFASQKKSSAHPYKPDRQRQKAKLGRPKVIEWKNHLIRFWYLLENDKYDKKVHQKFMSILSEMEENKRHVTLEWLKDTKVTEYLEKFEKAESMFDYDPQNLVGEMAGSILQFWNKEFPLS